MQIWLRFPPHARPLHRRWMTNLVRLCTEPTAPPAAAAPGQPGDPEQEGVRLSLRVAQRLGLRFTCGSAAAPDRQCAVHRTEMEASTHTMVVRAADLTYRLQCRECTATDLEASGARITARAAPCPSDVAGVPEDSTRARAPTEATEGAEPGAGAEAGTGVGLDAHGVPCGLAASFVQLRDGSPLYDPALANTRAEVRMGALDAVVGPALAQWLESYWDLLGIALWSTMRDIPLQTICVMPPATFAAKFPIARNCPRLSLDLRSSRVRMPFALPQPPPGPAPDGQPLASGHALAAAADTPRAPAVDAGGRDSPAAEQFVVLETDAGARVRVALFPNETETCVDIDAARLHDRHTPHTCYPTVAAPLPGTPGAGTLAVVHRMALPPLHRRNGYHVVPPPQSTGYHFAQAVDVTVARAALVYHQALVLHITEWLLGAPPVLTLCALPWRAPDTLCLRTGALLTPLPPPAHRYELCRVTVTLADCAVRVPILPACRDHLHAQCPRIRVHTELEAHAAQCLSHLHFEIHARALSAQTRAHARLLAADWGFTMTQTWPLPLPHAIYEPFLPHVGYRPQGPAPTAQPQPQSPSGTPGVSARMRTHIRCPPLVLRVDSDAWAVFMGVLARNVLALPAPLLPPRPQPPPMEAYAVDSVLRLSCDGVEVVDAGVQGLGAAEASKGAYSWRAVLDELEVTMQWDVQREMTACVVLRHAGIVPLRCSLGGCIVRVCGGCPFAGGCLEIAWRSPGGCLEVIRSLSGGWRLPGNYLEVT